MLVQLLYSNNNIDKNTKYMSNDYLKCNIEFKINQYPWKIIN